VGVSGAVGLEPASSSVGIVGELDPGEELGDGDCGDVHFVVVGDDIFERRSKAAGTDPHPGSSSWPAGVRP
jgi:hypothetical protein